MLHATRTGSDDMLHTTKKQKKTPKKQEKKQATSLEKEQGTRNRTYRSHGYRNSNVVRGVGSQGSFKTVPQTILFMSFRI